MNYDIEKIEEIIDAHEEKHNQQNKYLNYSVVAALVIMLILDIIHFPGSGVHLFISFIVCIIPFLAVLIISLRQSDFASFFIVMSRESLLELIHLIKEDEDVREIFVQRLLSGKFMIGRDGKRIEDLYFKNIDRLIDSVSRKQEIRGLEDFITRK